MTTAVLPPSEARAADLAELVEQINARLQAGEPMDLNGFLRAHPEHAEELKGLLPAIALLADLSRSNSRLTALGGGGLLGELGDFRLLREVGRGGMGVVYEAEQISLRRHVALKVLPFAAALDGRQLQRFQTEAQAAAGLHHTHIVPVHYVGCERGVHYYAMQFVDGQTLAALIAGLRRQAGRRTAGEADPAADTVAQAAGLATERTGKDPAFFQAAARLGAQAAEAVDYAHQAGVVHRDVKPANLMVDARGHLWVTDFGLARVHGDRGLTQTGDVMGTLRYMSPEQARGRPDLVDGRTDVYSLGATLYELLTLEPVFGARDRHALVQQIVRDEPRPPRRVNPAVPAELEVIVLKALAKDPAERYPTAQELADDLRRFLDDRPVLARRPSPVLRLRRWARRHRGAVATAAVALVVVLVTAVVGLVVSNALLTHERDQTRSAEREARRNLEAADANLLLARRAVDEMYTQVAEELSILPHMQPYQRGLLQKALRFYEEFARRNGRDPAIRLEAAHALLRVGSIQYMFGRRREGEQAGRDALAALQELAREAPSGPQLRFVLGEACSFRGGTLVGAGLRRQAEEAHREAVAVYEQLVADRRDVAEYRCRLAGAYNNLGALLHDRPREAEEAHRRAIALCTKLVAAEPGAPWYRFELIRSQYWLGVLFATTGRPRQAEDAFRQALNGYEQAPGLLDHSNFRTFRPAVECQLGLVLAADQRAEEAEKVFRQAIAQAERHIVQFPDLPDYRQNLVSYSSEFAKVLAEAGRKDEAAKLRRSARDLVEQLVAEFQGELNQEPLFDQLTSLTKLQRLTGDLPAAEQTARRLLVLAGQMAAEPPAEPIHRRRWAESHWELGIALQWANRPREAAGEFRHRLAIYEQLAAELPGEPDYRYRLANTCNFLGIDLRTLPGEREAALHSHRRAIALCDRLVAEYPDQPTYRGERVRSHYALGIVLALEGRCPEAEQAFQTALAAYHPSVGQVDTYRGLLASVHNELAWLQATRPDEQSRDAAGAVASARTAVELKPREGDYWNTLGVALYRAGHWQEARAALEKSMGLRRGGDSFDWFFVALAHRQLGDHDEPRKWYGRAVEWMDKHQPGNEELRRFRAEATRVLGMNDQKD